MLGFVTLLQASVEYFAITLTRKTDYYYVKCNIIRTMGPACAGPHNTKDQASCT